MPGEPQRKEPVFLVRPDELKDPAARKTFVTAMADDLVAFEGERIPVLDDKAPKATKKTPKK